MILEQLTCTKPEIGSLVIVNDDKALLIVEDDGYIRIMNTDCAQLWEIQFDSIDEAIRRIESFYHIIQFIHPGAVRVGYY
ncbi:hypothetical protein [Paenibacillus agilis]|uniref:Uncharacterized protein n=1 Tax=Paenibacillus agilis TaxID=3020863 RepID=A0A559ID09_9BACL|nr:hypothetical protein [Paenibacillus agilis]TVX85558.1 hypothetical protein FPZ44_24695 [Paenibacillus agilis]